MKTLLPWLVLIWVASSGDPAHAQQPGTVAGEVALDLEPARRWASRYPGSGPASAHVHPVPAVVLLEGDLPAAGSPDPAASIDQRGGRFVPGALAVRTGTVVRFPNADPFYHNVFSYSGPRFDLGRYPPGESREVVFDEPGIVLVHCEVHDFMRAVVVVTDHDFHAVVGEDGRFRMDGVPPGTYTLRLYHPDAGTVRSRVIVTNGETTHVALELGG